VIKIKNKWDTSNGRDASKSRNGAIVRGRQNNIVQTAAIVGTPAAVPSKSRDASKNTAGRDASYSRDASSSNRTPVRVGKSDTTERTTTAGMQVRYPNVGTTAAAGTSKTLGKLVTALSHL
jgi:hypothetical protein